MYVETAPMPPTGFYADAAERIARVAQGTSYFPYECEEFGVVDGCHLVNRKQYDDGAAMYTTAYNFLIATNQSPINNNQFDERADGLLNLMLKAQDQLSVLMADVLRLSLRNH